MQSQSRPPGINSILKKLLWLIAFVKDIFDIYLNNIYPIVSHLTLFVNFVIIFY